MFRILHSEGNEKRLHDENYIMREQIVRETYDKGAV